MGNTRKEKKTSNNIISKLRIDIFDFVIHILYLAIRNGMERK